MTTVDRRGNLHGQHTGQFEEKPPLPKGGVVNFDDIGDTEVKGWRSEGFSAEEATAWSDAGFEPLAAMHWHYDAGFDPEQAQAWREAGFTSREADDWDSHGFCNLSTDVDRPMSGADEWRGYGFNARVAEEWYNAGFSYPDLAKEWLTAGVPVSTAESWGDERYTPEDAGAWCDAGVYTPEEAEIWRREGTVDDPSEVRRWRDNGFYIPEIVGDWKRHSALFYPEDVKQWQDAGFTPRETLEWTSFRPMTASFFRDEGFSATKAREYLEDEYNFNCAGIAEEKAYEALKNKYGTVLHHP